MAIWIILLATPLLAFLLCLGVMGFGIVDAPDGGRKTQKKAVPTAGGIAILAAMLVSLMGMLALTNSNNFLNVMAPYWSLVGFILLCAGIGLVDDIRGLASRVKLAILGGGAVLAVALSPPLSSVYLPFMGDVQIPLWVAVPGAGLWLFVMANAANFMDGSNGLSIGSSGIMALGMGVILLLLHMLEPYMSIGIIAGFALWAFALAAFGFLMLNMRGKLYAGDTGALSAGALLGVCGLVLAARLDIWVPAALALPFLVDVLLTLAWRVKHGLPFGDPHRDHAYQLLQRSGWGHVSTASLWWGMSLFCGLTVMAALYMIEAEWAAFTAFAVLLIIGCTLWAAQRARFNRTNA